MATEDYKLPKLNGDNYHSWSIRARAALVQKRCWDAIEPGYGPEMSENERKKNDEALTLLFLIVEDTFLDDIGDCIRAREAWNSLKEMLTKFGLLHILQLMRDFFNTVMKPNETIKSYLGRLMEIHRKLSSGGYAFTDREVSLIMLIGLPKSYESLILNLEKDEANLTTTIVKSKLLVEEKRISRNENSDTEERALHTKNFNSVQRKPALGKFGKKWPLKKQDEEGDTNQRKTKCFSCGQWGHISRNCDEARRRSHNSAKTAIDIKNLALSANEKNGSEWTQWILDSGATEHMTSDKEKFLTLKHYASTVEVANSEKIQVTGIGDIELSVNYDTVKQRNITLANVLYVPNLGGNLLSIGRIEERGFKVEFADGKAKVIGENGETILLAKKKGRLYVIEESQPVAYITKTASEKLWHRRLGHPHYNIMKELDSTVSKNEPYRTSSELCPVCIQGKMKRRRFPKVANTRAKEVLEIIHSDVVGKITPPSWGGSNYLVTFTDDFSHYTVVYPMKTKNEVLAKFDEYKRMVENLHCRKIKILRSDNGGEFKSEKFNEYLTRLGIQRQLTVPESPQQNGVSERMNQTLANTTRCLLIESGLHPRFWAEAMTTAAYLRNKIPSAAVGGNTPEKIWSGKEIKTEHLRVYGCRAWSHVRSHSRQSKLDPKAKECVLVGYPDGIKGYKLWDLKENKFFISRDVIFEEDIFPFKMEQHHLNPASQENVTLHIESEEIEDDVFLSEVEVIHQDSPKNGGQIPTIINKTEETSQNSESINEKQKQCLDQPPEEPPYDETEEGSTDQHVEEIMDYQEEVGHLELSTESTAHKPVIPKCNVETEKNTRTTKPPKYLDDYVLYNVKETKCLTEAKALEKDPTTVKEALASPEAKMWRRAMEEEVKNLQRAQTWELVTKPPNTKTITSRWIFRKKKDEAGNLVKFKARLVAKGYLQVQGVDFKDTFSPVIKLKSIRILLAIAAEMDLEIHQMDITAAYLNGTLEEDIYMAQPEGCIEEGREHLVCHLKKSLYGLRQSGRVWNSCLDKFLTEYNLKRSIADPCIYYSHEKGIIIGVYVDDLLIIGKIEEINHFKRETKKRFAAKDLGPVDQILSMKISKNVDGSITLDQSAYAEEILNTFRMENAKGASTPLDPGIKYRLRSDLDNKNVNVPYRQVVGSLLYLACGTRPDLSYPSTYMSQFNDRHSDEHWRGIKHILRYLKATKDRRLIFKKTRDKLKIFSDADWGGDRIDRKSFSGYVIMLAGAPVSWCSKKQNCTALSSSEAEYIAMCQTAKEFLWVQKLLSELKMTIFVDKPQHILVDNQGAMCIAKNQETSERSKHIDLRYFFLRDLVVKGVVTFAYTPSKENVADILTKSVSKQALCKLKTEMGF